MSAPTGMKTPNGWPGCCRICAAVLPEERTVNYCGRTCRGILRAWQRTDALETTDPGEARRKRRELAEAKSERMLEVAKSEGRSFDEFLLDRLERGARSATSAPSRSTLPPGPRRCDR